MRNFYFKTLLLACLFFSAGSVFAQFSMKENTTIGQKYTVDSIKGIATFIADFNTVKDSSYWAWTDTTKTAFTITVNKCQTQRGLQVNVYESDATGAAKIINGDFECRDYGANRNPVRVKSVASLLEILGKYEIKNKGTADSVKNVTWKPSACLFDRDTVGVNQSFGAHPGMYKVVEYGFQYNFAGFSVTANDISFEIDTYHPGNTGKTATYNLIVATGSATNIIGQAENFYVTGSGKKSVKLAAAIGKSPALFSNQKVYFFLKTMGTGTAMAKGTVDPTIVFDNMTVSYQLPAWISPAAGISANKIMNNSAQPLGAKLNVETLFPLQLKTAGRLGTFTITNDRESHATKLFTFLSTGAVKARDAYGKYTVDVPYTFTEGSETVKEKIEIPAPASGVIVDDDLMLFVKAKPASTTAVSNRIELNCGVRIWYDLFIKGVDVIDLSGIDKTSALADTLADVTEGAIILLGPGKTYTTGGYAISKSVEIRSSDPSSSNLPKIDCTANFNIAAGSNVGYIIFKNLYFSGTFDDRYVFNPNLSEVITVGEIKFEGCRMTRLRGVARFRAGATSKIQKFTMNDCVVDSIRDYAVLCLDTDNGIAVDDISITNSTFSKCRNFMISRMQSNSLLVENCTISEVPSTGSNYMFRWRGPAGNADITKGLTIRNTIWGHAWDESNTGGYAIRGHNGSPSLANTVITIANVYSPSQFAFGAGFELAGFPVGNYTGKATDLWIAPYTRNFGFADNAFKGPVKAGDPRWYTSGGTSVNAIERDEVWSVYPNPAQDLVKVRFALNGTGNATWSMYNLSGQTVKITSVQHLRQGINEMEVNTADLNEGVYIYRLQTTEKSWTGKLFITK